MAQKPPVPQAVPGAKDAPSTPSWLFLFYQWVVGKIDDFTSIFSTTDFVVGTATGDLGAERVGTTTTSITVDISTAGQMKWNVNDEYVQDTVGAMLTDTTSIDFTYTDATGLITADVKDEYVQDMIDAFIADSSSVTWSYNDGGNSLSASVLASGVDHGGLAGLSDDDHTQYYLASGTREMAYANFTRQAADPGADVLWVDDGTNYVAGTLVWPQDAALVGEVSVGAPGNEQGSILVNGNTYDAVLKVNDFGGARDGTIIVHRHDSGASTPGVLMFAKANSDTSSHTAVADNTLLGEIRFGGWGGSTNGYASGATIVAAVDGTPGDGDMPTELIFATSPDGSQTPAVALTLTPAGNVVVGGRAAAAELRFLEPSGSGTHYTAFKAQAQAGNVTYILPAADGSSGQVLSTNGSGTLSWATGGSGSDKTPMTPQGRLTLATATPVMATEQAAKQTIYYTPYVGDVIPLYDGSAWANTTFAELTLSMAGSANWAANSNYDLYVYNDGGTIRLGTGAAWTSATARNESLTMVNGILTNAATMTLRYGASSTVSVAANRATYVGTMRTTANTGETTWELGGTALNGDPIRLYLWNCYNRVLVGANCFDSTDSWSNTSASYRSLNASDSNRASFVRGADEDAVLMVANHAIQAGAGGSGILNIGLDSTSAQSASAIVGFVNLSTLASTGFTSYNEQPGLGFHYLQVLDYGTAAGSTFYGDAGGTAVNWGMHFSGRF